MLKYPLDIICEAYRSGVIFYEFLLNDLQIHLAEVYLMAPKIVFKLLKKNSTFLLSYWRISCCFLLYQLIDTHSFLILQTPVNLFQASFRLSVYSNHLLNSLQISLTCKNSIPIYIEFPFLPLTCKRANHYLSIYFLTTKLKQHENDFIQYALILFFKF